MIYKEKNHESMINKEKNYEFRKRLLTIHNEGVRDYTFLPGTGEISVTDGTIIALPTDTNDVILTAAKDFSDYLLTSMGISAMLKKYDDFSKAPDNAVCLCLKENCSVDMCEADGYMGYHIEINAGIRICGFDDRGVAQALYYLEDLMSIRKAPFLKKGVVKRKVLFSPRMVHSGYGLDNFPNEHLSAIAHSGMDAILVFTKGVDLTPSGYLDFNELIYRAQKFGIDVYAYSYLVSHKHPEDSGAEEFYDNLYGSLFERCPGLKGIVLVGESVEFPSKDEQVSDKFYYENHIDGIPTGKPSAGWWPCKDYPQWLDRVKKAVFKHKKDADIVFWTYNWGYAPEEDRLRLIDALPTDVSLLVTYDMFETYPLGESVESVTDYTLSFAGPGKYFVSEAIAAKEKGLKLYAMTNTGGLTWDIGVIPYQPMPYQWIKRYHGMLEAQKKWGLCGIMESHHYGFWPSFISELAKRAFFTANETLETALDEILQKHFGAKYIEQIKETLQLWSEAITHYTPTVEDQYGAFRIGPSYPFCLNREIKPRSATYAMFGGEIIHSKYPEGNSSRTSLSSIRIHEEINSLAKMLRLMEQGVDILESIEDKDKNKHLFYLINLGKFICCCTKTGINAKNWHLLISKLKLESSRDEIRKLIIDIETLAKDEIKNAEAAIPLVEADSRLGWEPSMEYMTDAEHIKWKIRQVKYVLESELLAYKKGLEHIRKTDA